MTELPASWLVSSIGETFEVTGGGTPSTANKEYWGSGFPWITSADIRGTKQVLLEKCVTPKGVENSAANIVAQGSLLVVTRVGLGKIAIAPTEMCFSQDLQGLRAKFGNITHEYALHYLSYELQRLKFDGRGTTISGITKKQLKDTSLPIPPINEQRRIVEKIETLFADLDAGVKSLTLAKARLALYRQSVLKAAFEGRLTADWRAQNPDKLEDPDTLLARIQDERTARYKQALDEWQEVLEEWLAGGEKGRRPAKPKRPDDVDGLSDAVLEELSVPPQRWSWVSVGQLFQVFVGSTPSRKRSDFWGGDVPWVSSGEVQFCKIRDTTEKLTEVGFDSMSGALHPPGTVMLGMIGEGKTRGQAAILEVEATHNQNCAAIRVEGTPVPTLIVYYYFLYRYEITRSIGSGNNQKALNKTRIQNMPFPLCSPEEYREILELLEAKLTNIEALKKQIDDGLARAKALRQSILKRAFAGRLVDQDPNDEPAQILLERIRAEKAAVASKRRKRCA